MEFTNLIFTVEDGVAIITFNRPKALNAMNSATMNELYEAVSICEKDDAVKAVILAGAGDKAFVAGADISEMANLRPQEGMLFMELGHKTLRMLENLPKPSIAAINGFALGGGVEISMACDMRFCSEASRFGQPEILIGLIPGWGGTQRLARLVGIGRAKELVMAGGQIDAKRAYEIGLVNKVFPVDQLMEETKKAKHAINFGYDLPLDNANRLEVECCAQCFSTDDQKEGMKAFLEKRKPVYKGC
jgi:enoyl-CoA hydratase